MRLISASEIEAAIDFAPFVERLRDAFRAGCEVPLRHHHEIAPHNATLLLMPAWRTQRLLGVKMVTVFPGNAAHGLPSVMGVYVLASASTGLPLAVLDGRMLTLKRTAAASALAATFLARSSSARLLMVGTGALAPHLVLAHASVRQIREVTVWGRTPEKAERLARDISGRGLHARATSDLEGAARRADIICCATLARDPLIRGEWLAPGQHLDLVGGFTPEMREADDGVIERARLFVDTRDGALKEAGDIVQPLRAGLITERKIVADLAQLCRASRAGRGGEQEITLFKSVGTALEDLAAAEFVYERTQPPAPALQAPGPQAPGP